MATVVHLVEKTPTGGENDIRDDIRSMIIAVDSVVDTTSALVQARAVTVAVANGHDIPPGYFDTNRVIATVWDAVGDYSLFQSKLSEVIA